MKLLGRCSSSLIIWFFIVSCTRLGFEDSDTDSIPIVVAAGSQHSCAVKDDRIACWGANDYSQLGAHENDIVGPYHSRAMRTEAFREGVTSAAAGSRHTCAIVEGGAWCWGLSSRGQLGAGESPENPAQPTGLESGVSMVAAGRDSSCAIVNHQAWCWGNNVYGQVGNGTTERQWTPSLVSGLHGEVSHIATCYTHSCAVADDQLWCWGRGAYGALGQGDWEDHLQPVLVTALEGRVSSVSVIAGFSCAVMDGAAYCWGENDSGQIGDGSDEGKSLPTPVHGLGTAVSSIATGSGFACAIVNEGVQCWGKNTSGQLGDGTRVDRREPQRVRDLQTDVVSLAVGSAHACAALRRGEIHCWGAASHGQLGLGLDHHQEAPIPGQGLSAAVTALGSSIGNTPYHNCAIVDDEARCWGLNSGGQLGDGTYCNSSIPVAAAHFDSPTSPTVDGGGRYSCALVSGAVWCWGNNSYGQLGDGTGSSSRTPVQPLHLASNVIDFDAGHRHACAIRDDGSDRSLWCWGSNRFGELGNGTTQASDRPQQIIAAGVDDVECGYQFTCAVIAGEINCTGYNADGQLGIGTTQHQHSPTPVQGLPAGQVDDLATSYFHACAIIDGMVYCWGAPWFDMLGCDTEQGVPGPVENLPGEASVVAAGVYHSCAVIDGRVYCWGSDSYGQRGDGPGYPSAEPRQIEELEGVSQIVAGKTHSCALTSDGAVYCWGSNLYGELGDGSLIYSSTPVLMDDI